MWDVKAKVIPVVMGALGSVPIVIDVEISLKLIQTLDSVPWLP